ncbi:MAG: type III pantothenate kinase [Opitutaceae bacterium]|nr:type III pantothenate kinase [Cytophagales bacterium]
MMQENLCVDIGNTLIKAGIFRGKNLIEKVVFESYDAFIFWAVKQSFANVIISNVKKEEAQLLDTFSLSNLLIFDYKLHLPIKNTYKTPETLGKDRLASVLGAMSIFPGKNCLIIDAGTCITYDIINSNAEYLGGAISPGLSMRFKALNQFTAKLPLLETGENFPVTGNDTNSSIRSGVQNGMIYEIEGMIENYKNLYPELTVILCGGDSSFFESKIKGTIFAFPDLVLIGLNHSLLYNAPK